MRERLLAAFVGLTLLTVVLYGVPRAFSRADIVREDAQLDVRRSAQVVAEALQLRTEAGLPVVGSPLAYLEPEDRVTYLRDGRTVVLREGGGPGGSDDAVARVPADGGTVEVRRPRSEVSQDVVRALTPIVLTGGISLLVAVVGAVLLAARLSRPFQELAASAGDLVAGEREVELPPLRVREAEAIAAALRSSSTRVRSMLQRERDFARNASHQLRTPLTAMRLRVEDLTLWAETAPAVADELQHVIVEVDRLSDTVTALLAFAREERTGTVQEVALADVASSALQRWRGLAAERGRAVVAGELASDRVALPRFVVDQVLDVLVDNALRHGAGTVTLEAQRPPSGVRFLVRDEGQSVLPAGDVFRPRPRSERSASAGEGIGLSLCAELAAAVGGRLRLLDARPTTFALELPVR